MPRFFFHTADGEIVRDHSGVELPDQAAARTQAVKFIGDLVSDEPELLATGAKFCVEVTDAAKRRLFTVIITTIDGPAADEAA
jgi:3-deoxy-D-manno-octulosonate 8-phosphate phosphatase KdsC-like HAD superfamily phosphatase